MSALFSNFHVKLNSLARATTRRSSRRARAAVKRLRVRPKRLLRQLRRHGSAAYRRATGQLINGPRTLADNIRFFANPGPGFETADPIDGRHLPSRVKTIAFYLPQFHAFAENDAWWGEGFTEWRNVARGAPRFKGHYQPRIPRDLGFYDLNSLDTIKSQCDLAKHNGIDAFCFYYYWFNGRRLMDKPLDLLVDSDIDQSFCIMWANENWTRTWDGLDSDVLIAQDYLDADEDAFIADTGRYMADARYVRMNDQPLFILYRPGLIPDATETIARWRRKWTALLGETPLVMMVQGFGDEDPSVFGMDGAVEFPPHKVCAGLQNINDRCQVLDSNYQGLVRDYADVVNQSLSEPAADFPLIKTVSPSWDNDARREALGMTLYGSTPALYEKWLNGAMDFALDHPVNDESVVFINAWNEWAEGAYLEPDVHYGHAYLNATKRATKGLSVPSEDGRILLVGHDAHQHGAQMLLLNMAKIYRQQFRLDVVIVLKDGGPLVAEYQRIAKTVVISSLGKNGFNRFLARNQFTAAICNTTVTGDLVPALRQAGVQVLSLIHEMPNLIKDYKLEREVKSIADKAHHVVFPAKVVQDGFASFTDSMTANAVLKPQGTYTPVTFNAAARHDIRTSLGIDETHKLVLGVGYADLRKGFDLFMETARRTQHQSNDVHFVWAGALSSDMQRWIQTDFTGKESETRIHVIGFTDRVKDYYSAADCLFLPSREDPYPTVVLEAMNVGLPVIAYRGTTGFDSLLSSYGYLVELGDSRSLDETVLQAVNETAPDERARRANYVDTQCRFDDYCFGLVALLKPQLKRVSVVIPNYNYAHYLEQRLTSIFSQSYPLFEVILLDDHSSDDSVAIAQGLAERAGRHLRVVVNDTNSGSVYKQWQRAADLARGERLWIAEADDSADPHFLKSMVAAFKADTGMAFCDSKQITSRGKHLSNSYQHYFSKASEQLFSDNFSMSGKLFVSDALSVKNVIMNVSAVLWDTQHLKSAMQSLSNQIQGYDLVGDWRLYLAVLNAKDVSVAFVADALNVHRRHSASVTHALNAQQHVDEIAAIHRYVKHHVDLDADKAAQMDAYLAEVAVQLGVDANASRTDLDKAA